jgi:bifunctional non-homologous end joining protein LigD
MSPQRVNIDGRELSLTHLDKVFYPETGFAKGQVIDYYARIAPALLPHLKDRPVTLKRYPDGVEGKFFYEKRAPSHRPAWLKTAEVPSKTDPGGKINYCLINDFPSLIWAANLGNLELHTFLATKQSLQRPTQIVFDLDPGPPADVRDCAEIALRIKELLARIKLTCLIKSTGSKGLQVHIPLNTPTSFEATKSFARALAITMQQAYPDRIVHDMKKNLREGKVLIDWSQNDPSKTTVNVYSLRARARPFAAAPLLWDEVSRYVRKGDSECFFLEAEEVLARVKKDGDLFANLLRLRQKLPGDWAEQLGNHVDSNAKPRRARVSEDRPDFDATRNSSPRSDAEGSMQRATGEAPEISESQSGRDPSLRQRFVEPMKCLAVDAVPTGEDWLYELKFDGYRVLVIIGEGEVMLLSRNGNDLTSRFAALVSVLQNLPIKDAILDGEIVALDQDNHPSFQLLQNYREGQPVACYLFDVISLAGRDWRGRPLSERRGRLARLLQGVDSPLFFSSELNGPAQKIWDGIRKQRFEGLVAKRRSSLYESGKRTGQWVKIKANCRQEFVIGGYTQAKGGRPGFGALLVGTFEENGLQFCGKVGSGFGQKLLLWLRERMDKLRISECPFSNLKIARVGRWHGGITASELKECVWIRPELVCEVQFSAWTDEGSLRHPSFIGLREDVSPADVHRELPTALSDG